MKTIYPKIGIRPTIDGRQGGIREGLEEKTSKGMLFYSHKMWRLRPLNRLCSTTILTCTKNRCKKEAYSTILPTAD